MLITREKFFQIEDELSEYIKDDRELYNVTKEIIESLGYIVPINYRPPLGTNVSKEN
jgi:hypothetical protein